MSNDDWLAQSAWMTLDWIEAVPMSCVADSPAAAAECWARLRGLAKAYRRFAVIPALFATEHDSNMPPEEFAKDGPCICSDCREERYLSKSTSATVPTPADLVAQVRLLRELVGRIREWDQLPETGDGPSWIREMEAALAATAPPTPEARP